MFVKLNERVYLNLDKITRIKIDEVQDGIRVRFYELNEQVAKSKRFNNVNDAKKWLNDLFKEK
jgi:hypothetical protein